MQKEIEERNIVIVRIILIIFAFLIVSLVISLYYQIIRFITEPIFYIYTIFVALPTMFYIYYKEEGLKNTLVFIVAFVAGSGVLVMTLSSLFFEQIDLLIKLSPIIEGNYTFGLVFVFLSTMAIIAIGYFNMRKIVDKIMGKFSKK